MMYFFIYISPHLWLYLTEGPSLIFCAQIKLLYHRFPLVFFINLDFSSEDVIPFKNKSLIGIGVDKSKLFLKEIESKSIATFCSTETGVIEIDLNVSKLLKTVSQSNNLNPSFELEKEYLDFVSKFEQAVFFGTSQGGENPILFEFKNIDRNFISRCCLEISTQILNSTHPLLPNIVHEQVFLIERINRMNDIIKILFNNNLVDEVFRKLNIDQYRR